MKPWIRRSGTHGRVESTLRLPEEAGEARVRPQWDGIEVDEPGSHERQAVEGGPGRGDVRNFEDEAAFGRSAAK